MRGLGAFLTKEFREIMRTWRIWVLPGIVLFLALSGPVLAALTPQLLKSVTMSSPGMVIELPDPTWRDAYAQWAKNLSQIVTYALIIILGGLISAERKGGTAVLVLTKPVTRTAFIVAKYLSQAGLLFATTVVGACVTWAVTLAVFGTAPVGTIAAATGAWLAFGAMLIALMTLASATVNSQAGAAGLGFLALIVLGIGSLWGPALRYSPAGLVAAPSTIVAGKGPATAWPVMTGLIVALLALAAAVAVFRRKEL